MLFCLTFESKIHFGTHSHDETVENAGNIFRGQVGEGWWGETEREIWFVSKDTL